MSITQSFLDIHVAAWQHEQVIFVMLPLISLI